MDLRSRGQSELKFAATVKCLETRGASFRILHSAFRISDYASTITPGCGWMILIFGCRARIWSSNQRRESSSP